MLITMVLYAGIKLDALINRQNPNVSTFTEELVLTSDDHANLKGSGLRFAWTIEGYGDKELKNDPRYVKPLMRMAGRKEGKIMETILDWHMCTEEDFEDFAPPT